MNSTASLIQRNANFATHRFTPGLRMVPSSKTIIVACVDPRVDPSNILELELGEAAVIRNVGGRVTPTLLQELDMLRSVTRAAGGDLGPGWQLIIMHHTDCGITRLTRSPEQLAAYFQVDEDSVQSKAINDPRAAVAVDVATLKTASSLSRELVVSGLVYDVTTGLAETVVTPSHLGH
jgi:carbonic anhydrase